MEQNLINSLMETIGMSSEEREKRIKELLTNDQYELYKNMEQQMMGTFKNMVKATTKKYDKEEEEEQQ